MKAKLWLIFMIFLFLAILLMKNKLNEKSLKGSGPMRIEKNYNESPLKEVQHVEYVVIVKRNSKYKREAESFSKLKNAELVFYTNDIYEVLEKLRLLSPKFAVVFLEPEELTSDFLDMLDVLFRRVDDDPYLDVAYGIITARNKEKLREYIERLLRYHPKRSQDFVVYSLGYRPISLGKAEVIFNCLTNCGGAICVCDDEERATSQKIIENFNVSDFLIVSAHGLPSQISLDKGEKIIGDPNGLFVITSDGTRIRVNRSPPFVVAISCLTSRISGSPKNVDPMMDLNVSGNVNTSIVLSFLESGTLVYIGAHHSVASLDIIGRIIEDSFIEGEPVGIALKNFKNIYIMNSETCSLDNFTKRFVLHQVKSWILFGDPSLKILENKIERDSCLLEYNEIRLENKTIIDVLLDPNRWNYLDIVNVEVEDNNGIGLIGNSGCAFFVKNVTSIKVALMERDGKEYNYNEIMKLVKWENLGDEVLVKVMLFPSRNPKELVHLRLIAWR